MSRKQALLVGSVAYDPKVIAIWDIIRSYYQENGLPIDYVLFSNYEAQVDALLSGFIDIGWNTNVAYVQIQQRLGGRAKVLGMRDTDINYTSKFIVRADKGIRSLQDLKGMRVALGSADSAQAAILPYHYLKESGIDPERDITLLRYNMDVGKHGDTGTSEYEVLRALKQGDADAGVVGESTWIRMLEQGMVDTTEVHGIWTSPGYSHCNFTVLPDFDGSLGNRFTELLFAMDPAKPAIRQMMEMEGLNEWVSPEGAGFQGYEVLAEAMKDQGML